MARRRKSSDLADPKAVGCLSAIFRLLHTRFHGRRRLTQVGKTEQSCIHPEKLKEIAGSAHSTFNADQNENIDSRRSLPKFNVSSSVDSCKSITSDGSQSTMLATVQTKKVALEGKEMLRKESSGRSNVVARLMGLEELPVVKQSADQAENASEMRDMIVGALLRCDEEVRALGRVIKMIQSAERYDYRLAVPPSLVTPQTNFGSLGDSKREEKEKYVSINLKVKAAVDCPRKYMHFNQSSFHCQKRMSTKGNYWLQHDKGEEILQPLRRCHLMKCMVEFI